MKTGFALVARYQTSWILSVQVKFATTVLILILTAQVKTSVLIQRQMMVHQIDQGPVRNLTRKCAPIAQN